MFWVIPIARFRGSGFFLHATTLPWLALAGLWRDAGDWRWSLHRAGAALFALAAQTVALVWAARRRNAGPRDLLLLPTGALGSGTSPLGTGSVIQVAFAGPLVNAVLWLVLSTASQWTTLQGYVATGGWLRDAGRVNLALALLHLLPSFPMAGGRVFRAVAVPWGGAAAVRRAAAAGRMLAGLTCALAAVYAQPALAYLGLFAALAADAERRQAGHFLPPGVFARARFAPEEIEVSPPPYARATRQEWIRAFRRAVRAPFDALYERWRE